MAQRCSNAIPDRFLLGSDTWVNERWQGYGEIMAGYRAWLAQLPPAIAAQIAHGNARTLFGADREFEISGFPRISTGPRFNDVESCHAHSLTQKNKVRDNMERLDGLRPTGLRTAGRWERSAISAAFRR